MKQPDQPQPLQLADRVRLWGGVLAASLSMAGCASFSAVPIEPAATLGAFEARTLDSPQMQQYVVSHLAVRPVDGFVHEWTLESLTLAAFYDSPELDLARARAATAEAAVQTASQRPNPSLQLPLGYTRNAKPGESPYTWGLALDVPIETAGKRGYRVAAARQWSTAARLEVGQAAWQVRSDLRTQMLKWFAAQRRSELLAQQVASRQALVQLLTKRLSLGASSTPEVLQARAELLQQRVELEQAAQQMADARTGMAAVIGLPEPVLAKAHIRFDAFETAYREVPKHAARDVALLNRADLLAALAAYEASQATLHTEVANQYPDIHLGLGYTYDAGAHKFVLPVSGITLPLFNQNDGPMAEAMARRKEAAARFNVVQASAVAQTERAVQHYHAALASLRLSQSLLATQRRQSQASHKAFDAGESDRLGFLSAQLALQTVELSQADALAAVRRALGELEDALQTPMPASSTKPLPERPE